MRPLSFLDGASGMNGHFMFSQGDSEKPQIGTVEDWYYINFVQISHPMHIHLVNSQQVGEYQMKVFKGNGNKTCLKHYYQLDFYL